MLDTQAMWDRFGRLPRAGRWAAAAAIGAAAFLLWDAGIRPLADEWNSRADVMLADSRRAGEGGKRRQQVTGLADPIRALGVVEKPGDEPQGNSDLLGVVNDVLKRHRVTKDSFNYRGATKLPRGALAKVIHPKKRLERITGDLRFEATQEDALAIISELESSPLVEAVSSVRLTRQSGPRKLTVDLTLDAWIEAFDEPSRRTGGT